MNSRILPRLDFDLTLSTLNQNDDIVELGNDHGTMTILM